ncbi:sodium/potassium-transporting ATPase subunit beta-1-like [Hylaeus anthracinus]|uniref:sodium/potassium-transporting ATPase subunit beta-1-like n=1 Tax=Hylaeus anthracinus TaxID=313031 RepID=UPI0023B8B185|nr:sodium/potassium-transporting ATPase subunit beta-1-like [Hylaeus anthracinus]
MVILHDHDYYESRKPRPDLGPLKNFLRFVWDKERKTFLDRTAKEWGQLGIFYACFYTVLATIFAVQMKISIDYVSRLDKPFFQYTGLSSKSFGGQNYALFRFSRHVDSPGIVFKPNSMSTTSPIISIYNSSAIARPKRYIRALTDFLQEYNTNITKYDVNCEGDNFQWVRNDKPCFFDIKKLGECSRAPYGYTNPLQPCVLIKFNKRFDWVPKCYNRSSHLPQNMPDSLKRMIEQSKKFYVWLSCDGANNVDKEHIGEIKYIPSPGFPVEYFPFSGQPHYLSPIVALQFKNLTPNRLVTVECTLWASNIKQRSSYSLDFQILIDNRSTTI